MRMDRAVLGCFCAVKPFGFVALEDDAQGGRISTRDFFERYVNQLAVSAFHDAPNRSEEEFQKWCRCEASKRIRDNAVIIIATVASLVCLHAAVAWQAHADSSLSRFWNVCALSLAAGVIAALTSGLLLLLVPAGRAMQSPSGCVPVQAIGVLVGQFLFTMSFTSCIWLCCPGTLRHGDCSATLGPLPSAPFQLLVVLLHTLWLGRTRNLIVVDMVLLAIYAGAIILQTQRLHLDVLRALVQAMITCAVCAQFALTMERFDRVHWLLSQETNIFGNTILDEEGSQVEFMEGELSVTKVTKAYSNEASYYIRCYLPGSGSTTVLWSISALRCSFLRAQVHGVSTTPYFDRSLQQMESESVQAWISAEMQLKRTLTHHIVSAAAAAKVLGIDRPHLTPRLQVLVLCVGSNGDVQALLAIARGLQQVGHQCRFATHMAFKEAVEAAGLEFFPLATMQEGHWDPAHLLDQLRHKRGLGDFLVRPQDHLELLGDDPESAYVVKQILQPVQPALTDPRSPKVGPWAAAVQVGTAATRRFVAQAVVANPWAVAHIHIAERLGIPCHIVDTMPWHPTCQRGHPLGRASEHEGAAAHFEGPNEFDVPAPSLGQDQAFQHGCRPSYWQQLPYRWHEDARTAYGLPPRAQASVMLRPSSLKASVLAFRDSIGLPAVDFQRHEVPDFVDLQVPFLCLHSPSLLERPREWGPHVDICGYPEDGWIAAQASRPQALDKFLRAGSPPIFVGFGSVETNLAPVAEALVSIAKDLGVRVVLQRGAGTFGQLLAKLPDFFPDSVFYIGQPADATTEPFQALVAAGRACMGPVDHEWLFPQCRALCHQGSAGTLHRGLRHGKATLVIGFMRGQPFWGGLLQHHGAGRLLVSWKATRNLVRDALVYVLTDVAAKRAEGLQQLLESEPEGDSVQCALAAFHKHLPLDLLNCDVCMQMSSCQEQHEQKHKHHHFVRAASIYIGITRLKLCSVCCYAVFVQGRARPPDMRELKRLNLAAYHPMDWGLARRKKVDTAGILVPFSSLEQGGLVGPRLEMWDKVLDYLACARPFMDGGSGVQTSVGLAKGASGLEVQVRDSSCSQVTMLTPDEEEPVCIDIADAYKAEVIAQDQRETVERSSDTLFAFEIERVRSLQGTARSHQRARTPALVTDSNSSAMQHQLLEQ